MIEVDKKKVRQNFDEVESRSVKVIMVIMFEWLLKVQHLRHWLKFRRRMN